ncbi:hypothetical protein AN958_00327 [Leucoagaricus sp. SymC.cos]|nr:hypothetical protein AN958_00327 [Leucoagaricus sp. SymC.cos]
MPGRVWEYQGERFYSPNSTRNPGPPPREENLVTFAPGASRASDFQNPQWWNTRTEWLAFVPRQPVPYAGVWFDSLSTLPKNVLRSGAEGYKLHGQLLNVWNALDQLLCDVTKHLGEKNNLDYLRPFPPYCWKYHCAHSTEEAALEHVKESRDWFSIWIGLLYWMTRKTTRGIEGITPPDWYIQAVEKLRKQREIDVLRCTPLLHSFWDIDRAGVFLHNPLDKQDQPPVNWFIEQNIPVWYRWGSREEMEWSPALIRPSPDEIANSTDVEISRSFIEGRNSLHDGSHGFHFPPPPDDNATGTFDHNDISNSQCESETDVLSRVAEEAERLRTMVEVFEDFTKKRARDNQNIVKNETTEARAKRLQRETQPPTRKATVFVWEWSASDVFGPRAVAVEDRVDTLLEYSHYGARFYDAFRNEWNCWPPMENTDHKLDDDFNEEDLMYGSFSPRPTTTTMTTTGTNPTSPQTTLAPPSSSVDKATVTDTTSLVTGPIEPELPVVVEESSTRLKPFKNIRRGENFDAERLRFHVLDLLSSHFGFVAPIPLPATYLDFVAANDYKAVSAVLGLSNLTHDNLFLKTPLGKMCTRFVCCFVGQSVAIKPPPELWDLAADNWRTIKFSDRLSSIRTVKNDKCTLFMFDLAGTATAPWSLAVYSASAALFVCRLDEKMHEEAIAIELVSNGIPFRTLQRRDTLQRAPVDRIVPSLVPWRLNDHVFDSTDWEIYRKQCRSVMSLRRARAALLRGGFVWRIGLDFMDLSEAARGPWGIHEVSSHIFSVTDSGGIEYIDDELTQDEYDVLCGIYRSYTGFNGQVAQLSWFPSLSMFEGSGLDNGRWTLQADDLFERRIQSIHNKEGGLPNFNAPLSATRWRDRVHGYADARRANKQLEKWSKDFIEDHVGHL